MKSLRYIVTVIPLLIATVAAGQVRNESGYKIRHYGTKEGLANEFAWRIVQDSVGFIWVGSPLGLCRFDGYEFKHYKFNSSDTLSPSIKGLTMNHYTDKAGNIWIGGHHTYNKYFFMRHDRKTDRFIRYELNFGKVWVGPTIHDPGDSLIWVSSELGLVAYNLKNKETIKYPNPEWDRKSAEKFLVIDIKSFGQRLLLATSAGLWFFDKETKDFSRLVTSPGDSAIVNNLWAHNFLESKWYQDETLWVRSAYTLYQFDTAFHLMRKQELSTDLYRTPFSYARDKDGVFWFGHRLGGLIGFDPKNSSIIILKDELESAGGRETNTTKAILIDKDENLWIGTDRGINVAMKPDLKFYNHKISNGRVGISMTYKSKNSDQLIISKSNNDGVTEILQATIGSNNSSPLDFRHLDVTENANLILKGRNLFWVGSQSGVNGYPINSKTGTLDPGLTVNLKHDPSNPNTISTLNPVPLYETTKGLFVSGNNSIDQVLTNHRYGTEGSVIRHMVDYSGWPFIDTDSSFWLLNSDDVLDYFTIDGNRKGKLRHIYKCPDIPTTIYRTTTGNVYLGSLNGLYEISKIDTGYNVQKTFLSSGAINFMQEDNLGRLWLYGDNGLKCFDPKMHTTTSFGELDDIEHFQEHEDAFLQALHKTSDGRMLLVAPNGITMFDPQSLQISKKSIQPVLVGLMINNAEVAGNRLRGDGEFRTLADISILRELTLDYKHNNFSITFSGMSIMSPEKNRYKHRLEGYDDDWIETDYKNRTATYTNLPQGTYTFRVKASNHHGVWSDDERTLEVTILPPPWKTAWAYAGYTLIVLGLLFAARRMIVQRERLKGSLKLEKVEREKEHFELEKAKEVDRVKTSFFTNISHEFRTPLTLIKGPVQNILDRYKDDPKLQEQLKLVERNSDLLLKLINQLLDLAKLDAGNLKIEKSKGEVMRFVKATGSSFTSLAAQKDISLNIDVPDERCIALFDRDKLETILINLVNNAIKFTPTHGKVNVSASLNNHSLLLNVRDTGIGIPAGQLEKIFERFHQVSESHKEVGTGIGLALVKELVALLGGTIAVQSEVGKGSEFIVTLPLEMVSSEDHIETHEPKLSIDQPTVHVVQNKITLESKTNNGEGTRPHILVVEDNADLRSFIIESLGDEFLFLEAENGRQGLNVATTEIPDLIISDVMMPEMDGITMAEKIKTDVRTSHIPLILLTAKSTEASKLTGLESGADDYLTKPFNKHELLLKIRNAISRQRKLREKVMAELMSDVPRKEVLSADEQFLSKVKEEILKQMSNEQLSVESLAEQIGMSRVHLYRKISGLTGMSVNELIRKLRLHRAAQLLQQQWGPVSQVAYEVGFSNLSYFSKVFKEEFGTLPSEYADT